MTINLTIGPTGYQITVKNWCVDHLPREGELVNYKNHTGTVKHVLHDYDANTIYIRAW